MRNADGPQNQEVELETVLHFRGQNWQSLTDPDTASFLMVVRLQPRPKHLPQGGLFIRKILGVTFPDSAGWTSWWPDCRLTCDFREHVVVQDIR